MKMIVYVLCANIYSFKDEQGKLNEGCSIRYITSETLEPCENSDCTTKGYKIAKAVIPYGEYSKLGAVPALYEVNFDVSIDSKGAASLKLTEIRAINQSPKVNKLNLSDKTN
jgi:hypothetical protein